MKEKIAEIHPNNIITTPSLPLPELKGVGALLFEKMKEHDAKIAHTDSTTGKTETYKSILQQSVRVALTMRSKGIQPNDVITICSNTTIDSFIPFYASFFLGAVSANIDPIVPPSDFKHLLKLACPKMIFAIPKSIKLIEDIVEELNMNVQIVVFGDSKTHEEFSQFLLPHPKENTFLPFETKNVKETAVIVFSSGSTGLPKGVCLTHMSMVGPVFRRKRSPILCPPVWLTYSNLFWISAVVATPFNIYHGTNRVTCAEFNPLEVWDVIKKYKVGALFLNSYHMLEMCKNGRPENADTSSLLCLIHGGAKTTAAQNQHVKSCLPESFILNTYGQTEANGSVLLFNPHSEEDMKLMQERPSSVGRPIAGITYKIADIETEKALGPNQEGELRLKTDFLMNDYYKMDSSEVWDSDGFFKTGDVAYYDEDRCFFIVDRIKETLKYRMMHISPSKIENVLLTHPAVHNSIVIGIPHEVDGDHLVGVVILKESAVGTITEEELQKYVDDQVGDHQKLRGGVRFVKEFPLTATNKINRRQMKEYVLEGKI